VYYWFLLDWVGPLLVIPTVLAGPTRISIQWDWLGLAILLVPLGLDGPTTINSNWIGWAQVYYWFLLDWVGPLLLIPMGLGQPTRINMQWVWLGPALLLVPFGLGGPTAINSNRIGWAYYN
jgi:hypothetical protein